ncbi:MAG: ABC transporter ATP-binding protein [Candidatus Omnitrophica bacterium]|nr:ABC transporter ATP-binding protein [Candidatus Omnitrophota bacterium]
MIKVENVSKNFGKTKALDSVSFEVLRGEVVGILGPNGAGKTTLIRILTGFFPPSEGKVLIDGLDLSKDLRAVQRLIGYLPESAPLYKEMTPHEIITFSARMKGVDSALLKRDVERTLEICGIASVRNCLVGTLSKGFRQRTALGAALVGSPRILILDEPTSGLDPEQIIEIRDLIRNLSGDRTVILSTHILHEAAQLTERVLILQGGRLLASDRLENLREALSSSQDILASIAGPSWQIVSCISGIPLVTEVRLVTEALEDGKPAQYLIRTSDPDLVCAEISKRLVESGYRLAELKRCVPTLEEIYLKSVRRSAFQKLVVSPAD